MWASWYLKLPQTWLFVQELVHAKNKKSSKYHSSIPYKGNYYVIGGFPSQKVSKVESISMS